MSWYSPRLCASRLDEAPNIAREGAGLKRRGAMAGPKEGQPMDAELLKRAQRKAAGLKVGAEIHEENEVDKWIGPGSEPSSSRPDTSRSQASNAQLLDWDALDVDKEALKKEKIREQAKATLAKQRLRAITEGDKKDALAAVESDDSQDEDIEEKLGRAAAPMAEGALMSVFIKKEPAKATQAHEVQGPAEELEKLAFPVPEVQAAGDAHETPAASGAAGSQQAYHGKVHAGMPVRPRGLGTPRRDMLVGEVYRSSLDASTLTKDGLPWGRFHSTKPHYRTPEEKAEAVKSEKQMGFFQRMFGGGDEADREVVE